MGVLNTIQNSILNIIFPSRCLSCGKNGVDLCLNCLTSSPEAERESAKWIFPLFDYRHKPIKDSIWLLKYKGKKKLANIFAESMHGRILEELADLAVMENFTDAILVPIPLSSSRYRERGYNQAELICKSLVSLDKNENFRLENSILVRTNDKQHQARIENRTERLKNILGAFAAKNLNQIKNKNIILIDDVTTTGATLDEARKILTSAGARKVIAFTVAH